MSSSRIIKSARQEDGELVRFSFRAFGHVSTVPVEQPPSAGFVPMGLFQGQTEAGDAVEAPEESGPPPLEISEDELNNRISEAFNAGLAEGKDLAERGLVNVFKALRAASETIRNLREKVLREAEDELVNLVMLVARKVIIREVSQDRTILAGVVSNAVAGLSTREEITLRINPEDFLLITSGRNENLQNELTSERLQLKPDPTVSAGFCQVDTAMGTIDADMDAQLDEIYRHLLQQRSSGSLESP